MKHCESEILDWEMLGSLIILFRDAGKFRAKVVLLSLQVVALSPFILKNSTAV